VKGKDEGEGTSLASSLLVHQQHTHPIQAVRRLTCFKITLAAAQLRKQYRWQRHHDRHLISQVGMQPPPMR